jgi:uncharacterized membrane protein YgcG
VSSVFNLSSATDILSSSGLSSGLVYFRVSTENAHLQPILFADVVTSGASYVPNAYTVSSSVDSCSKWTYFLNSLTVSSVSKYVVAIQFILLTNDNQPITAGHVADNSVTCKVVSVSGLIVDRLLVSTTSTVGNISFVCLDSATNTTETWVVSRQSATAGCVGISIPSRSAIFSPCSQFCAADSWSADDIANGLASLRVQFTPKAVPLSITAVALANATTEEVTLFVSLCCATATSTAQASSNLVQCAVLTAEPSTIADIARDSSSTWSTGDNATLTIQQLVPATSYTVYCLTTTSTGIVSSLASALSAATSVQTSCCKSFVASLVSKSLYANTSAQNVLAVSVNYLPSSSVTVTLRAYLNGALIPNSFFPSSFTFKSSSSSRVLTSSAVGFPAAGIVTVSAIVTGDSAAEFGGVDTSVPFEGGYNTIDVITVLQAPTPPTLYKAVFANTGALVTAFFSGATDMATMNTVYPFQCSRVLVFPRSSEYNCQWSSDATSIIVILGYGASLAVGDSIRLVANIVRAVCPSGATKEFCSSFTYSTSNNVTLSAPATPVLPTVLISAPMTLGSCDDLILDVSSSSGSLGRSWQRMAFKVFSTDSNSTKTQVVQNFLNTKYNIFPPTAVSSSLLSTSNSYTVTLTLCNYLLACTSASHQFVVVPYAVASVAFAGASAKTVYRMNATTLTALGNYSQACGTSSASGNSLYPIGYSWQVTKTSSQAVISVSSGSKDPASFTFAAYSLESLTMYTVCVVFYVYVSTVNTLSSSACTQVYVSQASLVAVIGGGIYQSVRLGEDAVLDYSGSYDEDQDESYDSLSLSAEWSCSNIAPVYNSDCWFGYSTIGSQLVASPSLSTADSNWTIQAKPSSLFSVSITDTSTSRVGTAAVQLAILSSRSALVTIPARDSVPVRIDTSLIVKANVIFDSAFPSYCSWSVSDESLSLENISLTSVIGYFDSSAAASSGSVNRPFNLVLAAYSLPVRSSLRFTLTCTTISSDSMVSSAYIDVVTISSPCPGTFAVSPRNGSEVQTTFTLQASYWDDVNLPLTYSFGFFDIYSGRYSPIAARGFTPHTTSTLPAGSSSNDYAYDCYVIVFNTLGANTTLTYEVTVFETSSSSGRNSGVNTSAVLSSITLQVDSAANSIDLATVHTKLLTVYSSLLNRANCSAAPNCTALHRSPCSWVPNTCGGCLGDGRYVSADEFSNEACWEADVLANFEAPSSCDDDSDCAGWYSCNATSHECYRPQKSCSSENVCLGHGDCYYVDKHTAYAISSCEVGTTNCSTACTCFAGYSGQFCELTDQEFAEKETSRELLMSSLNNLTLMQDVSSFTALSWANSLIGVTSQAYELSSTTVSTMSTLTSQLLEIGSAGSVDFTGVMSSLGQVVDNLAIATQVRSLNSSQVLEFMSSMSMVLSAPMVVGQSASELTLSTFRLSALVAGASFESLTTSRTMTLPTSALEDIAGLSTASISFATNVNDSDTKISMAIIGLPNSILESVGLSFENLTSSPVRLVASTLFCDKYSATANDADDDYVASEAYEIKFTLPHSTYASFGNASSVESSEFTTYSVSCETGAPGNFTFHCPAVDGVVVNITYFCNGLFTTKYQVQCPVTVPKYSAPSCSAYINGISLPTAACRVLNYSAWHTECGCNICKNWFEDADDYYDDDSLRRRKLSGLRQDRQLLDFAGNSIIDIASTSIIVSSTQFATIMADPESLFSIAGIEHVVRVLALLLSLWLGLPALMVLGTWTKQFVDTGVLIKAAKTLERRSSIKTFQSAPNGFNAANVLLDYANSILPEIFGSHNDFYGRHKCFSIVSRCLREFRENVPIFILLFADSKKIKRGHYPLLVLKVLTIITFSLFALSFFFTLQYPTDNGACARMTTQADCLSRKSYFDKSIPLCTWSNSTASSLASYSSGAASEEVCSFLHTSFNINISIMMCILVVLATTPALFVIDHVFADVLFAPTSSELDQTATVLSQSVGMVTQRVRRASLQLKQSVAAFMDSSGGDVKHKVFERNIVMKPEVLSQRFRAVQLCNELPIFKKIAANVMKSRGEDNVMTVGLDHLGKVAGLAGAVTADTQHKNSPKLKRWSTSMAIIPILEHSNSSSFRLNTSDSYNTKTVLRDFVNDLSRVRRQLQYACETELFDEAWGIESVDNYGKVKLHPEAQLIVQREHSHARAAGLKSLRNMKSMSRAMCGAELMKLYFMDLMGSSSQQSVILEHSITEGVLQTKRTVTWGMKCLVVAAVVVMDLFFLYSCLLYAANRDSSWQRSWVFNSALNILIELLFAPVLEVFVLCCLVPSTITDSVETARKDISKQARKLCDKSDELDVRTVEDIQSKYFFASHVVALQRPDLIESTLICSFEAPFPFNSSHLRHKLEDSVHMDRRRAAATKLLSHGGLFGRLTKKMSLSGGEPWSWKRVRLSFNSIGVSTTIVTLLTYVGTQPMAFQRFALQLSEPLFIGSFGFSFSYMVARFGLFPSVSILIIAVLIGMGLLLQLMYSLSKGKGFLANKAFAVVPHEELFENLDDDNSRVVSVDVNAGSSIDSLDEFVSVQKLKPALSSKPAASDKSSSYFDDLDRSVASASRVSKPRGKVPRSPRSPRSGHNSSYNSESCAESWSSGSSYNLQGLIAEAAGHGVDKTVVRTDSADMFDDFDPTDDDSPRVDEGKPQVGRMARQRRTDESGGTSGKSGASSGKSGASSSSNGSGGGGGRFQGPAPGQYTPRSDDSSNQNSNIRTVRRHSHTRKTSMPRVEVLHLSNLRDMGARTHHAAGSNDPPSARSDNSAGPSLSARLMRLNSSSHSSPRYAVDGDSGGVFVDGAVPRRIQSKSPGISVYSQDEHIAREFWDADSSAGANFDNDSAEWDDEDLDLDSPVDEQRDGGAGGGTALLATLTPQQPAPVAGQYLSNAIISNAMNVSISGGDRAGNGVTTLFDDEIFNEDVEFDIDEERVNENVGDHDNDDSSGRWTVNDGSVFDAASDDADDYEIRPAI